MLEWQWDPSPIIKNLSDVPVLSIYQCPEFLEIFFINLIHSLLKNKNMI